MLCYVILCYIILYYNIILYYIILYCNVLYYIIYAWNMVGLMVCNVVNTILKGRYPHIIQIVRAF